MAITKLVADSLGASAVPNQSAFKNLIINGDMSIAQRGTSFTGQEYTLDRWQQSLSGGTATVTQETFSSGNEVAQSKNYLRQDVSSGNNNLGILQRVESVRSIKSGGSVTFSFYAKGTNPASGGLNFHVEQRFGTGGSPSSNVIVYDSDTDIVLTSDWTRYTITFTFTDYTGKTFGTNNDDYIQVEIRQKNSDTSTNAWTLDITGVQLEAGTTASDFEFLPHDVNLQRCYRYYYTYVNAVNQSIGIGVGYNNDQVYVHINYPVEMRALPSLITSNNTNDFRSRKANIDYFDTWDGIQTQTKNQSIPYSSAQVSIQTGEAVWVETKNATALLAFNSEL